MTKEIEKLLNSSPEVKTIDGTGYPYIPYSFVLETLKKIDENVVVKTTRREYLDVQKVEYNGQEKEYHSYVHELVVIVNGIEYEGIGEGVITDKQMRNDQARGNFTERMRARAIKNAVKILGKVFRTGTLAEDQEEVNAVSEGKKAEEAKKLKEKLKETTQTESTQSETNENKNNPSKEAIEHTKKVQELVKDKTKQEATSVIAIYVKNNGIEKGTETHKALLNLHKSL